MKRSLIPIALVAGAALVAPVVAGESAVRANVRDPANVRGDLGFGKDDGTPVVYGLGLEAGKATLVEVTGSHFGFGLTEGASERGSSPRPLRANPQRQSGLDWSRCILAFPGLAPGQIE